MPDKANLEISPLEIIDSIPNSKEEYNDPVVVRIEQSYPAFFYRRSTLALVSHKFPEEVEGERVLLKGEFNGRSSWARNIGFDLLRAFVNSNRNEAENELIRTHQVAQGLREIRSIEVVGRRSQLDRRRKFFGEIK